LENHIRGAGAGGYEESVDPGRRVLGSTLTQFGATF
jgi:hypothetical protein